MKRKKEPFEDSHQQSGKKRLMFEEVDERDKEDGVQYHKLPTVESTALPNRCGASFSSQGNVQRVSVPGLREAPLAADSAIHDDAERVQDDVGIPWQRMQQL